MAPAEGAPEDTPPDSPEGVSDRGSRPSDERFPRSDRLRRRAEFLRVQRNGRRVHTPHFVVAILPRAEPTEGMSGARVGFTVTKKVAGSVGRNRLKRVLREVFRRNRLLFPDGCDMVVIAKSGAHLLGYEEARAELAGARAAMAHAARRARRPRREPGETDRR